MKKRIAFILSILLLLSLCACGKTQPAPTQPVTEPSTEPVTPETQDTTVPTVEYNFAKDQKEAIGIWLEVNNYGEVSRIKDLAPQEYWQALLDKRGQSLKNVEDHFLKTWDRTETVANFGLEYTYSFHIEKLEKQNKVALGSIADHLNKDYGIDPATVTEAYTLTVILMESGSGRSLTTKLPAAVVKIGDYWFAADITTNNQVYVTATFKVPGIQ